MGSKEEFEKLLNELAKKEGFLDGLVDLFAVAGDKKMVFLKHQHEYAKLCNQINEVIGYKGLPEECLDQLISLLQQFTKLTKDVLQEYNITL